MGLDNGVCIKRNEKAAAAYSKLWHFETEWDSKHQCDFDVCYWRKCYNIKNLILDALGVDWDEYQVALDCEGVRTIINVLCGLTKENWSGSGGSIWDWDEYEETIQSQIAQLTILHNIMQDYDLDVYFYNSY